MTPERAILNAALPLILQAPKDDAEIQQLCYRPDYGERAFVDQLSVTRAGGVENCRWSKAPWLKLPDGSGDPQIQVSILPKRILDLVWRPEEEGGVHPGDTFIVDMDMTEENLPAGTLLQAGGAVLRVSEKWNDACVKWKTRYGADALDWVRQENHVRLRLRGILCSVHQDGVISKGDRLRKVS
ncbi:MAG: hypothetical protein AAF429_11680 [Pseudomonadota bacterium]